LVIVAAPNHVHFDAAAAALRAGFHVMSEKPATRDLSEARELAAIAAASGKLYGLAHTYTGYPMVREARELVRRGALGIIRKVIVQYEQGWLSAPIDKDGNDQAAWRADPAQAGIGGCLGDIGVHAFNLAEFVTGLRVESLAADVSTFVAGRALDDDASALLRFAGGARGALICSQISAGARNRLRFQVYGERGGVSWSHERHTALVVDWLDGATQVLHAGSPDLSTMAQRASRLPTGHPEGFIEALANLYCDFTAAIAAQNPEAELVPGIGEAVRGMAFVEAALAASRAGRWIDLGSLLT
jgi:predicted dehydrogenase